MVLPAVRDFTVLGVEVDTLLPFRLAAVVF